MKKLVFFFICLAFIGCSKTKKTVSVFSNPAPSHSQFPFLYSTDNQLYMSWLTHHPDSKTHTLNFASYSDGTWSDIQTVAEGSSWFVNWADFPSIIADSHGPMAVHWLNKIPGGVYAYNVNISLKRNGEWTHPVIPHSDSTATEHGFASMIPWNKNTILAVWLDGRQAAGDTPKEYFDITNAMTLRAALITTAGKILERFLIDDSVCDCCHTTLIKTSEGALVAYRNRTENEIRDIYVSRFNGKKWTSPTAVYHDNWKIGACPVNGPQLASNDSLTVVTWPTAENNQLFVKAALSFNGGETFNNPLTVSRHTVGRVDAAIHNNDIYISWIGKDTNGTFIKLKKLGIGKSAPKAINVAELDAARGVGFPQLEILGDKLIMAWTAIDSTSTRVKTVQVDI